jgi:hypothetical protein
MQLKLVLSDRDILYFDNIILNRLIHVKDRLIEEFMKRVKNCLELITKKCELSLIPPKK